MALSESVLSQIRDEWQAAQNGAKSAVVRRWAQTLQVSYQTLYRGLSVGRQRKRGCYRIDGVKQAAEIVAQIKKRPPKDAGEIPTDLALRQAIDNGLIPEEMAGRVATINRVMRECGLSQRVRRVQRFQALYPNQLHHVDASSSQFFYIHREENGEFILRMHNSSGLGYKNKPVPIRLRPWVYGLTDDYSGVHIARYVAAHGESLADNLQFLAYAWGYDPSAKAFFGIPERIKADQGPLMKGEASREWLDRLDILQEGSIPGEKEAHGKIERPWRTMWGRFEKTFFVESDWKHYEITLSELNRRFALYLAEYNNRPHRYERDVSRIDAWRRINLRGGAVALPAGAIATAARRHQRTVGADGCISLDGVTYEVRGLHAAKVHVYEGIYEDRIVVEDLRTGEKYEAKKFAPTPLDEYRAHRHTPHQVAQRAAESLQMTNTLYLAAEASTEKRVTRLPTRVKEERQVANPFDVDAYPSIDAAMRDFASICAIAMDAENTATVRELIIDCGLKRSAVRELALEIQAEYQNANLG